MTLYINTRGRLGNNLFQLSLFLILKKKYPNHKLFININWIKHYYPKDYDKILNLFPNIKQHISNFNVNSVKNRCNKIYTGHILNYEDIKDNDNVLFAGFFQRTEYYDKYRDFIKNTFWEHNKTLKTLKNDEIVVHLRSGDLWGHNGYGNGVDFPWQPVIKVSFYKNILKNEKKIRFVVEKTDDPILLKLQEFYKNSDKEIIVQSENVLIDFITLANAKKIVLSVSTFSWWAAFLSDAEVIHIPMGGIFNNDVIKTNHRKDIDWTLNWSNVKKYNFTHKMYFNQWKGDKEDLEYVLNN